MTVPQRAPPRREVLISPSTGGLKRPEPKAHRTVPLRGWKRETAPAKSHVPLITVASVGIVLVAVIGKLLLSFVASNGVYFERAHLEARTLAYANSLDVSQIKALTGQPADESTPAFKALLTRLIEMRTAHPEVRLPTSWVAMAARSCSCSIQRTPPRATTRLRGKCMKSRRRS
jgi:hypothetical protein